MAGTWHDDDVISTVHENVSHIAAPLPLTLLAKCRCVHDSADSRYTSTMPSCVL